MLFSSVRPLTVIVHGTFHDPFNLIQSWSKPGGEFYDYIAEQAKALGHETISYRWSGYNNILARIEAAQGLTELILKTPGRRHILIGHSHGGNVIALTSEFLALLYTTPDPEKIAEAIATRIATTPGPILKKNTYLFNRIKKKTYEAAQKLLQLPLPPKDNEHPIIETAFLLATPVSDWYQPHADIIRKVISLYSHGDQIQTLVGQRTYAQKAHITNIRVIVNGMSPSHRGLHAPTIGKWLLSLAKSPLQDNSVAHFTHEKEPEFRISPPTDFKPWYYSLQTAFNRFKTKFRASQKSTDTVEVKVA